ncbi:protein HGH1 homolog [Anolis sagrei]|uniref:protein HGH1 homolog n=1 Tax=Anolis sagrei TaxID=38937 RepID=UPI0035224E13
MDDQQARELLDFLGPESRPDLRAQAVHCVAGLTVTLEGRQLLTTRPDFVEALLALTSDPSVDVAKEAFHALINLATEPDAHIVLAKGLPDLLGLLLDPGNPLADQACVLLSNFSREEAAARQLLTALQRENEKGLVALVDALGSPDPQAGLHYLGPLLSNLSQLPEARKVLLDPSRCVIQKLLPFTQFMASDIRRGGIVGTLRNCCFEYRCHEWLLGEEVDLLPFLLLPLAGPEEFPDDEMEKLPLDLQYLPPEKEREPDPDIRKMLLEAIMLLTATKPGRHLVREKGTYLVLRELHRWEADPGARAACEKVIQVLIAEEPPSGMENLLEVEIPTKVEEELQRLDQKEEEELQKEELAAGERPEPCPKGLRR